MSDDDEENDGMNTGDPISVIRNGTTLRAWLHGPSTAPLVAFIHGGFMDRHMFDPQLEPLVEAGYQALTWDLRGHGESSPRGDERPTVADMAEDLFAILDHSGHSGPAVLVGQSLGGMVGQYAALTAPGRVSGLMTIGAPCINPEDTKISRHMAAMWRVSGFMTRLLPTSAIRGQLPKGTAVTEKAQQYVQSVTGGVTKDDFRWLVQASAQAGRGLEGQSITAPQLVTRGEHDNSGAGRLTAVTAPQWIARDHQARYEVIPGAGHQAHQDQPELFNRLLHDFLRGLARRES